ncbi:hypothetical protein AAF712_012062 [Marasmius tenuissimus]|uniref:F-box domain-containing protein n=1 Tax=Marasmius tenuissimus TaxID=585030 RepID=A0ABR2ZHK7_9AGAR
MLSVPALNVKETVREILSYLPRLDLSRSIMTCRPIQEDAQQLFHTLLRIAPDSLELAECYVQRTPDSAQFTELKADVTVPYIQIISLLSLLSEKSLQQINKVEIMSSKVVISPSWEVTGKKFPSSLRNLLANVNTLTIRPVDYQLQKTIFAVFSQITTLVLHGGMANTPDRRWERVDLEALLDMTLVSGGKDDHLLPLVDRYLVAPQLKRLTLVVEISRDFSYAPEIYKTYRPTLRFLRIVGRETCGGTLTHHVNPLISSNRLEEIDLQMCWVPLFLPPASTSQTFPALKLLVLEESLVSYDNGLLGADWHDLAETLDRLRGGRDYPEVRCGYRGDPVQGEGLLDTFQDKLNEVVPQPNFGIISQVNRPDLPSTWRPQEVSSGGWGNRSGEPHPWDEL